MKDWNTTNTSLELAARKWGGGLFVMIQISIMLLAISHESLWIDEFWAAYFAGLDSFGQLHDLLFELSGSQTPLHFAYYYLWGLFFPASEVGLRLANLPWFVLGQVSLFWALRPYPRPFTYLFLAVSSLHPLVWQYANEARPYIMLYAGSEMIFAYLLHMNTMKGSSNRVSTLFSAMFVVGSVMLFGASMLGAFWVFAACLYVAYFHYRHLDWHYVKRGATPLLVCVFLIPTTLLALYYLNSVIHGGGASRLSSTTAATVLFDAYELLGLSGVGPGRIELRDTGLGAFGPYWFWLAPAAAVVLPTLISGLREAKKVLGSREMMLVTVLGLLPLVIVISSGFVMHWRVLGRHLIAELPLLNALLALGVARLFQKGMTRGWALRRMMAVSFFSILVYSSCSLRFADRHRKDDYRTAAAIAQQDFASGKRVWWAADALGAKYYDLPGEFDFMGELTGKSKPYACIDWAGVQSIYKASEECLKTLSPPDVIILSKPETFDNNGTIAAYLSARNFVKVRNLPAFTIWRAPEF